MLSFDDRDIGSLSALFLAANELKSVPVRDELLIAYNSSEGTAFKLAVAFALLERGNVDQIHSLSIPYLFPGSELVSHREAVGRFEDLLSEIMDIMKSENPSWDNKRIELSAYEYLAVNNIIEIVLNDIGSQGQISKSKWGDDWKRE